MRRLPSLAVALALALAAAACGSKVNAENYARIQEGMAETEVIALLGKPTESSGISILGVSGTSARWVGSESVITVQFVNGKVRFKSFGRADIR
jgi:hypothetical protein